MVDHLSIVFMHYKVIVSLHRNHTVNTINVLFARIRWFIALRVLYSLLFYAWGCKINMYTYLYYTYTESTKSVIVIKRTLNKTM